MPKFIAKSSKVGRSCPDGESESCLRMSAPQMDRRLQRVERRQSLIRVCGAKAAIRLDRPYRSRSGRWGALRSDIKEESRYSGSGDSRGAECPGGLIPRDLCRIAGGYCSNRKISNCSDTV